MKSNKTKEKLKNEQEKYDEADRLLADFFRGISDKKNKALKGFFDAGPEKLPHEYVEEYLVACIAGNDAFKQAVESPGYDSLIDEEYPELKKHFKKKENKYILMSNTLHLLQVAIENQDVDKVAFLGVWLGDQFAEERLDKGADLKLMKLRQKGLDTRQLKAKESHELIKKSLDELYKQGEGFKKTYPQIAKFLLGRNLSSYTESQTLKLVKKYAPLIKKKYS